MNNNEEQPVLTNSEEDRSEEEALSKRKQKEEKSLSEQLDEIIQKTEELAAGRFRKVKSEDVMVIYARFHKIITAAEETCGKHPEMKELRDSLGEALVSMSVLAYSFSDLHGYRGMIDEALKFLPETHSLRPRALRLKEAMNRKGVGFLSWMLPCAGLLVGFYFMGVWGFMKGAALTVAIFAVNWAFIRFLVRPDIYGIYLGKK